MDQCLRSTEVCHSLGAQPLRLRAQELADVRVLGHGCTRRTLRRLATRQEGNCVSNLVFFARSTPHPTISRSLPSRPRKTAMPGCFDSLHFQPRIAAARRPWRALPSARIGSLARGASRARLRAETLRRRRLTPEILHLPRCFWTARFVL